MSNQEIVMQTAKIAAVLLSLAAFSSAWAEGPKVGDAAPDFSLVDQNGKTVKLSDFSGKIVVLEWFNNECPFVQKQYKTGAMNDLASKYATKGVVWLAINSTSSADASKNAAVAKQWNIDRPILDDHGGSVGRLYGATNTPNMYIIDAHGKLAYRGAIDSIRSADEADIAKAKNYVAAALDELLAGKPVSTSETQPYGCTVKYGA